jgi:hypothetical protein
VLDEIHHLYFVKLELIETDPSEEKLQNMIEVAQKFYDNELPAGLNTKVIQTDESEQAFDIVDPVFGIELGSYGIRSYRELSWVYGTGVALPRLNTVINKLRRR